MKSKEKIVSLSLILILILTLCVGKVYAADDIIAENQDYSDAYKQWLELSDEEKSETLEPRMFDVQEEQVYSQRLKSSNNKLKVNALLSDASNSSYNLKDIIPENVKIKNQMSTNSCWAFTTIATLESTLAMQNYLNGTETKTYDFSERHMVYSSFRNAFLNNQINKYGYNSAVSDGGTITMASAYLTNGNGAIAEADMEFEDNEDNIDIESIQNKTVISTIYDTEEYVSKTNTDEERTEMIAEMKSHISTYGGLSAQVYSGSLINDYYNNETGAMYCNDSTVTPTNHAVEIIGWDDEYSKDNFNSANQPQSDGAWIIKNSWGESTSTELSTVKTNLYNANTSFFNQYAITTAEDIPTAFVVNYYGNYYGEDKVTANEEEDKLIIEIGNNGYMYISYEDCNIYSYLWGITKATDAKDYDNIYQYDLLTPNGLISLTATDTFKLANVYTRDSSKAEELTSVSIFTYQEYTCKVYVNPANSSKDSESLQEVALAEGDTITIEPGYHTIEFANPVNLTGDSFVVALEISTNGNTPYISLERENSDETSMYYGVEVNEGESYILLNSNGWKDLALLKDSSGTVIGGNACLKAFTNYVAETSTEEPSEGEGNKQGEGAGEEPGVDSGEELGEGQDNELETDPSEESGEGQDNEQGTDPSEEPEVDPSENLNKPVSSNFDNAKATLAELKIDSSDNSYSITIEVSGIKIGDEADTYTYQYYFSGSQSSENIPEDDWLNVSAENIQKQSDGTYKITITISDINSLPNTSELLLADNIYLHIRETAEIDGETSVQVKTLKVTASDKVETETDKKVDKTITQISTNTNKDNTTAKTILPNTGLCTLFMAILLVITVAGISYYRYKNIDK